MKPDVVLLLDTYFYVIVWRGENIQSWINDGYHELPDYEYLKPLIEAPMEDVSVFFIKILFNLAYS